jgi:hypothetical protein
VGALYLGIGFRVQSHRVDQDAHWDINLNRSRPYSATAFGCAFKHERIDSRRYFADLWNAVAGVEVEAGMEECYGMAGRLLGLGVGASP